MFLSVLFLFIFNSFHFFVSIFDFRKKCHWIYTPRRGRVAVILMVMMLIMFIRGVVFMLFLVDSLSVRFAYFFSFLFFSAVGNTIDYTPFIKTSMMNFSMWKSNEIFRRVRQPVLKIYFRLFLLCCIRSVFMVHYKWIREIYGYFKAESDEKHTH